MATIPAGVHAVHDLLRRSRDALLAVGAPRDRARSLEDGIVPSTVLLPPGRFRIAPVIQGKEALGFWMGLLAAGVLERDGHDELTRCRRR